MNETAKYKAANRSQNATVRQVCIMMLNFFNTGTVRKIIDRIKTKFTPYICGPVYEALNPNMLLLDVYNFKDTPCTGTNNGTCESPCTPFDPMALVGAFMG